MSRYTTQELDCLNRFIATGTIRSKDNFNTSLFEEHGYKVYSNINFTKMRLMELWHESNEGIINGLEEVPSINNVLIDNDIGIGILGLLFEGCNFGYQLDTEQGYIHDFFVTDDNYKKRYNQWLNNRYIKQIHPSRPDCISFVLCNGASDVWYNITSVRSPSEYFHQRHVQYSSKYINYNGVFYKSLILELMCTVNYFTETVNNVIRFNGNNMEWDEPLCPLFYYDNNDDNSDPLEVRALDINTLEVTRSYQFLSSFYGLDESHITERQLREFMHSEEFYENLIYYLAQYPNHRRAIINL